MSETELTDDMLKGADAIAAFLGESKERVYRLLKNDAEQLGAFRMGGRWYLRKSTFLKRLEAFENGQGAE